MANTRDTLGDQATLDGLINHTLTSIEEDSVLNIRNYALHKNTVLQTVNFPSVKTIGERAFESCEGIEEIIFPEVTSIGQYAFLLCLNLEKATFSKLTALSSGAFSGCKKLNALILGNTSAVVSLTNNSALSDTAIEAKCGAVYVPTNLIDTYKANNKWKDYFIADINEYPIIDFSTITDTWSEIFAAENDGTYSTKYAVGDTKKLTVNGEDVYMQIVAMDTDTLSAGGTAKITWISKDLLSTTHSMNSTNTTTNGWAATAMRTWLRDTILPTIDSTVRSQIKEVTKTYKDDTTRSTLSISDTVWIPSYREIFGGTSYEDSGCVYTTWFNNASRRRKNLESSGQWWWLRTATAWNHFTGVNNGGYQGGEGYPDSGKGVAIGFCT